MWTARRAPIGGMQGETIAIAFSGRALSAAEIVAGWRDDEAFREFFIAQLTATPYSGFFWEMPPLTRATLGDPFECAVIRGDDLARMRADPHAFAGHLTGDATVTAFHNLGRDALLIAPRRMSAPDCYGHIAVFLRRAPPAQQHDLFALLARKTDEMLDATPDHFWISTSGLGAAWVHVRLDTYPKYYQYRRYADVG